MSQQYTWTPSLNTDTHGTGDVIAACEELKDFARVKGGGVKITSTILIDKVDAGVALDIIFLNADPGATGIGAESAAFAMTDAVAETLIGYIQIPGTYLVDAGNNQSQLVRADKTIIIHPLPSTTSVFAGVIARGTITPGTTSDIIVKFGREYL